MGRGGVPVPKPQSRAAQRVERLKAEAETKRQVYHSVKVRDHYRCRSCGTTRQVDVHHLKFRSAGGGTTLENALCLCRICHDEIHAYRMYAEGQDANHKVQFVKRRIDAVKCEE